MGRHLRLAYGKWGDYRHDVLLLVFLFGVEDVK